MVEVFSAGKELEVEGEAEMAHLLSAVDGLFVIDDLNLCRRNLSN